MQFTEWLDRLKIKIFKPATIVYRQFGYTKSEFVFCSWLPAFMVFSGEPIGKDGYYKTVYINNKRVKPWHIIPRSAFIEVRQRPKDPFTILGGVIASFFVGVGGAAALSTVTLTIIGVAASVLAVGALAFGAYALMGGLGAKTGGGQSGTPTYSSNDSPSLAGAKNEILERQVPIVIGRTYQVFNYAQYATPLVKSGYSGNRFRTYFIPSYKNVNFYNFSLGSTLINNYKSTAYRISEAHGVSNFIGWDNAQTESFNNKQLDFDNTQSVFYSAIAYYNQQVSSVTSFTIKQKYYFRNVDYNNFSNKKMSITVSTVENGEQIDRQFDLTITKSNLVAVPSTTNEYSCDKTINVSSGSVNISEILRVTTEPTAPTRNNSNEAKLLCFLNSENIAIGSTTYNPIGFEQQSVDSYKGDRVEVLSQSPTQAKCGDIHFSFPQGLYKINKNDASRISTTIKAEITWKRVGETNWRNIDDDGIVQLYVRNIDGVIIPALSTTKLSNRVARSGNVFTFKSPDDLNNANNKFFECVGIEFAEAGQYIINMQPVVFEKDNYFTGSICVSEVVWRLDSNINVVNPSILPSVSQVAATFNATTQLEGDIDELGCISFAKIMNLETSAIEESRNPVDIIYYLLTDEHSNPRPMSPSQIDMPSFLKARKWCDEHECKTDGIINEEIKYSAVLDEICSNNQLYLIPNKWGKVVLRVDTNEDNRPIKTIFTAENSWDLSISRIRGKMNRLLALRCSYIDEETWSEKEITGYWYNNQCNWTPEEGKDDLYYQPEKRDLNYVRNADAVKRRIAYELEIANVKNTTAEFHVAREVLDLEVLDRVLVADYTRIDDGVCGTVDEIIEDETNIIGVKVSQPFVAKDGMTISIRSVDISGEGANVNTYRIKPNDTSTTNIMFETPIPKIDNIMRTSGFYVIDNQEFYYSGDLYMAGTAEIMSMVIKSIEEVDGDSFTSKITCRTY